MAAKHRQHVEAKSRYEAASRERESIKQLLEKRQEYEAAQKRLKEQTDLRTEYMSDLRDEKKRLAVRKKEARTKSAEARKETALSRKLEYVQSKIAKLDEKKRALRKKQSSLTEAETWLRENKIGTKADVSELEVKLGALQRKARSVPKDLARSEIEELVVDDYSSELVRKAVELSIASYLA